MPFLMCIEKIIFYRVHKHTFLDQNFIQACSSQTHAKSPPCSLWRLVVIVFTNARTDGRTGRLRVGFGPKCDKIEK